jgi:adenylosuccinate lyase
MKKEIEKRIPHTEQKPLIPNELAERYASTPMCQVWSPEGKILFERDLWITVMKAQSSLGLDIPQKAISAYRKIRNNVDLDSIKKRELQLRHDEKARLEEFNNLAGYEYAHLGMTSRDQSDNVEQMQIKTAMELVRERVIATLARFSQRALENESLIFAQRTHYAPAQPSLVGKEFSDKGEELLRAYDGLNNLIKNYPLRGIKGATGTQTDQLQLLKSPQKVDVLEKKVAEFLGFKRILNSVGQIYPRSLDFEVTSALVQLGSGPSNFAQTMRLMAGNEQFTEGFKEGQVGSTAMPHKMNSRTLERAWSLLNILKGFNKMTEGLVGNQWFGGDVSCSATRRVALANSFFAVDGLFQSILTVLDECGFYPKVIEKELNRYLPFLTTTRLLMTAVENGIGRETAHKVIRDNSVRVALDMREKGQQENDLIDRLSKDSRLGLSKQQLEGAIKNPIEFVGRAPEQIKEFASKVEKIVNKYPEEAKYNPEPIL